MSETAGKTNETENQADDDVEIIIEADEQNVDVEVEAEKPREKPGTKADQGVSVDDALAQMKANLANERAARLSAERRAQEAQTREHAATSQVDEANLRSIEGAIAQIKSESAVYKARYAAAMASGDYTEVAELQEAIAGNSAKMVQLEQGKAALESRPKQQPRPVQQADPVEALAQRLDHRGAEWIRAHPEFARDPRQYQRLSAAHNLAVADGVVEGSDEYYNAVETTLRIKPQNERAPSTAPEQALVRKPPAPAAAPVSRGERSNVVRLTSAQKATAEAIGMTVEEYARNLVAARKAGKMTA